ncbi:MAG: fumarylacetoacetate hydrolase family protein [Burkholderiaceae bacterium]|nr:fumarylacetoacetate hydrolase family protein [Burkholderiaceae bacterium]
MRIVNLDTPCGWRVAAIDGDTVIDLNRARQLVLSGGRMPSKSQREQAGRELPAAMEAWLASGLSAALVLAREALQAGMAMLARRGAVWAEARQLAWPLAQAALAPPIAQGANVLGIGLNYRSHAAEAKMELPKFPMVFAKPTPTLSGPCDPVTLPQASRRIDYEGEIVIVIGRRCKEVGEEQALDFVAGYTLGNDLSARDWQFRTSEIMLGKAFDGFCPVGPWLLTADDLPDVAGLTLETRVNGELRQSAPGSDMIFSPAKLVSYLSQVMTLEPGDAIMTGTPAGIGATRDPRLWLAAGDRVEVSAGPLGTLVTLLEVAVTQ